MNKRHSTAQPSAVVLGAGGSNGLGQIRALGQIGVKVFCIATRKNSRVAAASRYATWIQSPDPATEPEAAIQTVLDFGKRQTTKPVLLFVNDAWLVAASRQEEALRQMYLIPQSRWSLIGRVLNKGTLYPLAEECGIPVPRTWRFPSIAVLIDAADELTFPCVSKPEIGIDLVNRRMPDELRAQTLHQVCRHESREKVRQWAQAMLRGGLDMPVVVQEFIPGGAETLYTLTSYSNIEGKLLAGSVGHKVRQYPPNAGTIVAGRLHHKHEVFEQGKHLLEAIQFHGLANTEFKYDARDGSYRLMEINPRLGVWNGSALAAGINLPAIAYRDMLNQAYDGPTYKTKADGLLWLNMLSDAVNCLWIYKHGGHPDFHLGLWNWLKSIRGRRIGAIWQWTDPMPGVMHLLHFTKSVMKTAFRKALLRGR